MQSTAESKNSGHPNWHFLNFHIADQNSYTLPRDVIPFDQMPPCDDCLQRARSHGSYGDICQNLETDENCGFHNPRLPYRDSENGGYCCKHQIPSLGTRKGSLGSNMMIQRQNSYDEKEEVEAVESSV